MHVHANENLFRLKSFAIMYLYQQLQRHHQLLLRQLFLEFYGYYELINVKQKVLSILSAIFHS